MHKITTIEELEALYDAPVPASIDKVRTSITPKYRQWIEASRFVIISTVGPEGTDASPRGDDGPVVQIADETTIHIPDWRGNNRLDNLKNIVRDGRISLMFMVPGSNNVVRVNGMAYLTVDPDLTKGFDKKGVHPKTVIIMTVKELYVQCAKAMMRAAIWSGKDESNHVPSVGELIKEQNPDFDAKAYDEGYAEYAKPRMW